MLPEAATTTKPFSTARRAASVSGSSKYDSVTAAPTDMFTTRMLCVPLLRIAHSSARMTSLMTPWPFASSTFRLTMCAPGAIPARDPYES